MQIVLNTAQLILCFGSTFSGKKRKPAWTDRILWRIKPKSGESEDESRSTADDDDDDEYTVKVIQDMYTCDVSYGVSDHKPVIGIFRMEVRNMYLSYWCVVNKKLINVFGKFYFFIF